MSSEVESDDGFDPSPLPAKRRRLSPRLPCDSEYASSPRSPHIRAKSAAGCAPAARNTPKKKTQKPKHLIRIHDVVDDLEDNFCTQLPDLPSSPWRIRGARWQKPRPNPPPLADKSLNISASTSPERHKPSLQPRNRDDSHSAQTFAQALTRQPVDSVYRNPTLEDSASPQRRHLPDHESGSARPNECQALSNFNIEQELADLPSDAFASSSSSPQKSPMRLDQNAVIVLSSQPSKSPPKAQNRIAPQKGMQQMTLFGCAAQQAEGVLQSNKTHNWPLKAADEPPTHHKLDEEALKTYVYPTNLGSIRDYQFSIVKRGLYHNLLVALPTGLGKTFIAATIMLNWFRWTKDAQIVFVAPTKPLVSQQVEACFRTAGIPRSQTTMLTGGVPPARRAEEWTEKRVFFMTPQTIINDLKAGICDPKRIVLLVVDEAHRATGSYAYVEVVKFIRRFNQSFRVLALTATPGNSVETVQEVIDGLDISRVEIRTEFSIDIRQYVHARNIEQEVFEVTEEMELIMDLFSKALQPILDKLRQFNAYWSADPMQLSAYGLTQARQRWFASAGKNAEAPIKGMLNRIFSVLASLAHSIELLKYHGIGPFYHGMVSFQSNIDSTKGNKYEKQIAENENFRKMMTRLKFWVSNPEFIGHPKLDYLQSIVLKHFSDAGEARGVANGEPPSSTRIMVFVHYRDSAEEIVRVLKRHSPMIRPHVFVGQAASKGSEGMDQKKQLEIIQQFKSGKFNTLVATSIGEEGLDIGEIDLIICYDSSASPIRMLQRMGRTGRKRAGNIILLLMRGKEENSFVAAKDNYEKMQQMISDAKRFSFHDDRSRRIVPKYLEPVADKTEVVIPMENEQTNFLPEPKARAKTAKKPAKKFHMPDGVRTGFIRASKMGSDDVDNNIGDAVKATRKRYRHKALEEVEHVPPLSEVFLTKDQRLQLSRYQDIPNSDDIDHVVGMPSLNAYTNHQSVYAPTAAIKHGHVTKSAVRAFKAMRAVDDVRVDTFKRQSDAADDDILFSCSRTAHSDTDATSVTRTVQAKNRKRKPSKAKPTAKRPRKTVVTNSDEVEEAMSSSPPATDPHLRIQSQGIDLGSDTSGEDEAEGEPSSELRDFIADDNEDMDEESDNLSTSSSETEHPFEREKFVTNLLCSSREVTPEGSEDEELPDLKALLNRREKNANSTGTSATRIRTTIHDTTSRRKRRVIEDSSD